MFHYWGGPLNLILASLTGQKLQIKAGSRSNNLTTEFINYLKCNLPKSELSDYINNCVKCFTFPREDSRNQTMSEQAKVRLMFGSNESANQIEQLPHSLDSITFKFVDKYSEIWLEHEQINQDILAQIIKVFSIYGQLGCTSPKKIVLVNGTKSQEKELYDRLIEAWPTIIKNSDIIPPHVASKNILIMQLAKSHGYKASLVANNQAVVAYSEKYYQQQPSLRSDMVLPLESQSLEIALSNLPQNIQTIGCALSPNSIDYLRSNIAKTRISRIVNIHQMHHFNTIWDGHDFWKQFFYSAECYV